MKFFSSAKDGGAKSHVQGFWIIEIKSLFSIVLLRFDEGSREAYHTHAFNALTWWLKGHVTERHRVGVEIDWRPSWKPKFTPRYCYHKVFAHQTTWALTIRGPWQKTWKEQTPEGEVILTNGRKIIG